MRLHTKCIQPYKSDGNVKMPSGVGWEDISISPSIARHQDIEAVSGPKLIADCFRRHRRRPCRRPARSPIQRHGPAWIGQSVRRLCRSSEIIRFPAAFFGESPVGQSWRFRRRKKTGTSRLHTFDTFIRPYALRMQPYAVRMHFFGSSRKLGGSRAESACREPYALYAPLLGVGVFSAFFLLRKVHTVHTAAYG